MATLRSMSTSHHPSHEIHATAHAHEELGHAYHDPDLESVLAKAAKEIDARLDPRLAPSRPPRPRQLDAATLAKRRQALKHKALGAVAAAIPLSFVALWAHGNTANGATIGPWTGTIVSLAAVWILIGVVYAFCALGLMSQQSDRDDS
jgi:hypothetical protein